MISRQRQPACVKYRVILDSVCVGRLSIYIYMLFREHTDCHWKRSDVCLLSTHAIDIIHHYSIAKLLYKLLKLLCYVEKNIGAGLLN